MEDDFGFSSDTEEDPTNDGIAIDVNLKNQFNQAAAHVQNQTMNPDGIKLDSKSMLTLYGLFKVGTIGKCKESKPGILDLKGRGKWTAWNDVSNISKAEAMEKYVSTVKKSYSWSPDEIGACSSSKASIGNKSIMGGNAVSTLALSNDDNENTGGDDELDQIFTWIKNNQLESVENWLKSQENDPNKRDKDGLTLLHWAVDRGHLKICELLLQSGANVNLPDSDGDTPVDYAVTCDHLEIVKLLKQKQ